MKPESLEKKVDQLSATVSALLAVLIEKKDGDWVPISLASAYAGRSESTLKNLAKGSSPSILKKGDLYSMSSIKEYLMICNMKKGLHLKKS